MDVLADIRDQMAERITAKNRSANPEDTAKTIKKKIARIRHFCGARDGWTKRSNDGHEARENYCAAPVFFIEVVRSLKVAPAEKEGVFATIKRGASGAANPIANLIARDGAEHDWKQKPLKWNNTCGGEDASSDQQGVTGKKKTYKKARFDEHDGANQRSAAGAD